MQLKIKKRLSFIYKQMARLTSWNLNKQEQQESVQKSTFQIIEACSKLTMDKYLTCLCDGDLTPLIISGTPTPQALDEAWVLILSEAQELRGDHVDMIEEVRLIKLIRRTRHSLFLLEQCLLFLNYRYSRSIAESLNRLGYPFKPAITEPDAYRPLLERIALRARAKYQHLQGWVKELEAAQAKRPEKIERPKRESFDERLIQIEELQHVSYSFETLTVSKFLMLEKKLKRYVESRAHRAANKQRSA